MRGGDGLKPEVGAEDAGQKVLLNAEETAETKKTGNPNRGATLASLCVWLVG